MLCTHTCASPLGAVENIACNQYCHTAHSYFFFFSLNTVCDFNLINKIFTAAMSTLLPYPVHQGVPSQNIHPSLLCKRQPVLYGRNCPAPLARQTDAFGAQIPEYRGAIVSFQSRPGRLHHMGETFDVSWI